MPTRRPISLHLAAGISLIAAASASAATRAPPAYPPYPAVRSLPAVADWAKRYSDLPLDTIVGVGVDSVFAVSRAPDAAPGPAVRVVIRQEAVTPDFAKRLGGRSATMTVDIDCAGHRVFQRAVALYVGSNLQGPSRALGAARDWQAIPPGTYMERVMTAVCDPSWRPVYGANSPVLAPPQAASQPVPPRAAVAAVPRPAAPVAGPAPGRAELGRFDTADPALAAWRTAGPAASGRRLRIELATASGRTVYRAVVEGFAARSETVAFCRTLQAQGAACALVE